MKKIIFFSLFLSLFTFISCSEEEDDTAEVNNPGVSADASLVGAWEPTNLSYIGESTTDLGGQSITMNFSAQSLSFDEMVVNIYENNTYDSSGSYTVNMTINVMGQENTQELALEDFFGTGTWSQDGNTFITTDDESGNSSEATIEILNETTLKLTIPDFQMELGDLQGGFGESGTVEVEAEITMERI